MTSEPPLEPLPPERPAGDAPPGRVPDPAGFSTGPGGGYSSRSGSTAAPPPRPAPSNGFFDRMRSLQITRTSDRWIGGVAGGIAYRTGLDVALVRGIVVVLAIFGGIGVLLYGLAWALLPEPDGRIHAESAGRGTWTSGMTGALLLVIAGLWRPNLPFLGDEGGGWGGWGVLWTLIWVGAAVYAVYWALTARSRNNPAAAGRPAGAPGMMGAYGAPGTTQQFPATSYQAGPPPTGQQYPSTEALGTGAVPPRPADPLPADFPGSGYPPTTGYTPSDYLSGGSVPPGSLPPGYALRPVPPPRPRTPGPTGSGVALSLGVAVLAVGIILALDYAALIDLGRTALPVALASGAAVLGIAVVTLGLLGRSSGFVGFAAGAAVFAALIGSAVAAANFDDGASVVGRDTPLSASSVRAAEEGYTVVAGRSTLDLRSLDNLRSDVVVPVRVLASNVDVLVPNDVPVEVRSEVALGSVRTGEGVDASVSEGFWQPGTTELNETADGPSIILEVGGAVSRVSVSQNEIGFDQ
ncbi:PspC domain-containing protein [Arthrobacter sp. MSA 4-2]|uniref:PspC domain-containing protein n=1 Tax=Arthrobacter sp. MSA 4-2 TaxID=2794349 RepID=UPI0018E7100D|nr:PspC domain-containing protein [Arthrobacter sp. MSA 4-2]MBJ2120444.1 PspC domain-containing protein [Arthrobacter sp. MSA 4-2]